MTERKAFEEWFSFRSPLTRDEKGAAWEAWQARAAQPSEPLPQHMIDELAHEMVKGGKSVNWLARAIERAIRSKSDAS
jgi:hypothetical protein